MQHGKNCSSTASHNHEINNKFCLSAVMVFIGGVTTYFIEWLTGVCDVSGGSRLPG
jgi:hypothetical protein